MDQTQYNKEMDQTDIKQTWYKQSQYNIFYAFYEHLLCIFISKVNIY